MELRRRCHVLLLV